MAEFAFLAFYKDYAMDTAMATKHMGTAAYERVPKRRQRGVSVCSTLAPVMEDEKEEVKKKVKRRFSLDFLFSRKKKQQSSDYDDGKRGSVDSNTSVDYKNIAMSPDYNRRKSSVKSAEVYAYAFS